jgi:transcriptional regulator with XRE-family HTH domain
MVQRTKSLRRDADNIQSPKSDISFRPSDVLREERLRKNLTQQQLAEKLGFRQRQISDLERARIDPRLSTIQNVARALDLELVLIPRHLITAVQGLQRAGSDSAKRPMYALADEETEGPPDNESHTEIPDADGLGTLMEHQRGRRKEPQ